MNPPTDRLSLLRSKYIATIGAKKAELDTLQQKLALIDELDTECNGSDASLEALPSVKSAQQYRDMALTPAVLDVLSRSGDTALTAGQVRQELLVHGFQPQGQNFNVSVAATLKRLSDSRKAETAIREGSRLFWLTTPAAHRFSAVA